jgi:hypothetical protein
MPAAALALMPKCLLCVLAYAGLGAALGLNGPEICGALPGSPGSWMSSLALPGAVLLIIALAATKIKARSGTPVALIGDAAPPPRLLRRMRRGRRIPKAIANSP